MFIMFKPIFMLCTAVAGLKRSNMAKPQDLIAWPTDILPAQSPGCAAGPMKSHGTIKNLWEKKHEKRSHYPFLDLPTSK